MIKLNESMYYTVELYKTHYDNPIRKRFRTYIDALKFSKSNIRNHYSDIMITTPTINGPSVVNSWSPKDGWFKTDLLREESIEDINESGRIDYEDDLVVVKHNGKIIYQGIEDDEPMKYENWKYDNSKKLYTLPGGYTKELVNT